MALLEEPIKEAREIGNYINGEWVKSKGPQRDVINPATGKTIARVPISNGKETEDAIAAAPSGFPCMESHPAGIEGEIPVPAQGIT